VLKASLNEEVSKAIDHQRVGLRHNGFNNVVLLLGRADLELLLQENGRLLVVVADDLVYDVFPVAVDIAVKETTIVEGFGRGQVRLSLGSNRLCSPLIILGREIS
jgi:hypothetical protein